MYNEHNTMFGPVYQPSHVCSMTGTKTHKLLYRGTARYKNNIRIQMCEPMSFKFQLFSKHNQVTPRYQPS